MRTNSNQILFAKLSKDLGTIHGPEQVKLRVENTTRGCSYISVDSSNIKNGQRIGFSFQKSFEVSP